MTFDYAAWKKYNKTIENRVGYMRSAWSKCFTLLGGQKVSPWLKRHLAYTKGQVFDNSNTEKPNVGIRNATQGINKYWTTYQWAVNLRAKKMMASTTVP